jgi:hypothetical protein
MKAGATNQEYLSTHHSCECEHAKHFDKTFYLGNDKHEYGKADATVVIRTPFGREAVCEFCAQTCRAMFPRIGSAG